MQTALSQIINLRIRQDKIKHQIETLMPDAIAEALQISQDLPDSKTVFSSDKGKIILCLRKRFCNPDDDAKLSRLDADIKSRTLQLQQKHSQKIEAIDNKIQELQELIEELEQRKTKLLNDRYLSRLKKEYRSHQEATAYYQPNLSVFIK